MFDFKKFLKEGGVEKYLLEAQFGNDIESRYQYIRPLMSRLPDSARTEAMIDGMEEARAEDDKMAFDFYFVETMKMLGLETELMEADSLINPEAEEIEDNDLAAAADFYDSLAENDTILDEFLQMPAQEEEEEKRYGKDDRNKPNNKRYRGKCNSLSGRYSASSQSYGEENSISIR